MISDANKVATTTNIRIATEMSRSGTPQIIDVTFRAVSASLTEQES